MATNIAKPNSVLANDSLTTKMAQAVLTSKTSSFSNAQAKLNLAKASGPLNRASVAYAAKETTNTGLKRR